MLARLTLFSLVMITVGSVDSVRNLPATALFGSHLIFFFILAAIMFLIPCALVSAELSAAYPRQGGIYVWVREAFGKRFALTAIWFQWIENVIWYPTILSFVAGTLGYLIDPEFAHNKYFLIATILIAFWGATYINLRGMKSSAWFSNICAISGLLIPMALITALGLVWYFGGNPIQINFSVNDLLPTTNQNNLWVALTGIILSFCGIEIATVHAGDVDNPQKTFPRALIYSVVIIVTTLIMGSLAIAIVLPQDQISLVAGIMQAFDAFLAAYQLPSWVNTIFALMLVIGGLGAVSNWIISPTKGLLIAAKDGNLPPQLQKTNQHDAPVTLLMYQAVLVTILAMAFLVMESVNESYWLLTALAAQTYMFMYIIMFATAIYLRIKDPERERPFKIPGGIWGMSIVAGMGIIAATITIIVGFIPPDNIHISNLWHYESYLLSGLIILSLPPFITYRFKQANWLATQE